MHKLAAAQIKLSVVYCLWFLPVAEGRDEVWVWSGCWYQPYSYVFCTELFSQNIDFDQCNRQCRLCQFFLFRGDRGCGHIVLLVYLYGGKGLLYLRHHMNGAILNNMQNTLDKREKKRTTRNMHIKIKIKWYQRIYSLVLRRGSNGWSRGTQQLQVACPVRRWMDYKVWYITRLWFVMLFSSRVVMVVVTCIVSARTIKKKKTRNAYCLSSASSSPTNPNLLLCESECFQRISSVAGQTGTACGAYLSSHQVLGPASLTLTMGAWTFPESRPSPLWLRLLNQFIVKIHWRWGPGFKDAGKLDRLHSRKVLVKMAKIWIN